MQVERMESDIPRSVGQIFDEGFVELSIKYANLYVENPKAFIESFKKNNSIRMACQQIVGSYKRIGAFKECLESGKNFDEWANRQGLDQAQTKILSETILIIYSITNQ